MSYTSDSDGKSSENQQTSRTIRSNQRHMSPTIDRRHSTRLGSECAVLLYVYNMQFYRSTNASTYRLVLSRHPPGLSLIHATLSTTNTPTMSDPQKMRRQIEARLATFRAKVDTQKRKTPAGYKSDFDCLVRETSSFLVGSYFSSMNRL